LTQGCTGNDVSCFCLILWIQIAHNLFLTAEGSGLLSLLKRKGWATGLSAGVGEGGYDHSSAGYMFSVNISLTDSGYENVSEFISMYVSI
jgi:nardilysin